MCVPECIYVHQNLCMSLQTSDRLDPLELELFQAATCVLGTELGSSSRAVSILNC